MESMPRAMGKKMEGLVIEDSRDDQASVIMKVKLVTAAREAWTKVKSFVVGKVVRKGREVGSMEVCKADRSLEEEDELVNLEEDGVVLLVEVEVADEEDEVRRAGSGSVTGSKGECGFAFLDCLEEESKDEVWEEKLEELRKRKKQGDGLVKQ
jgi:hypothetical protein